MEKTLDSREIYRGRIINVRLDRVELPGGRTAYREVVEHPGAVCIAAVKEDQKIILVKQFRKPVEETLIELPAGKLEAGEDPEECAARELAEETGYRAGKMEHLISFYTSPGFSDEIMHLFLATDLSPGESNPDQDEMLQIVEVDLEKAVEMVLEGKIKDSKTAVGILILKAGR